MAKTKEYREKNSLSFPPFFENPSPSPPQGTRTSYQPA